MDAAPNGRVWISFEKGSEMYVAQTDAGAKGFGAPLKWGSPQRGATIYGGALEGDSSGAYIAVNTFVGGEQNIYTTPVLPSLTVDVVGRAKPGKTVTLRVRDGGAPVRNAKVTVGKKAYKSGNGGVVRFTAPRAAAVKVTATGTGYAASSRTVGLR